SARCWRVSSGRSRRPTAAAPRPAGPKCSSWFDSGCSWVSGLARPRVVRRETLDCLLCLLGVDTQVLAIDSAILAYNESHDAAGAVLGGIREDGKFLFRILHVEPPIVVAAIRRRLGATRRVT